MVRKLNIYILLLISAVIFMSCEKDENKIVMNSGTASVLSANASNLVLTSEKANDTLQAFDWTPSDYGFNAVISYTLQLAKQGNNFENPKEVVLGNKRTYSLTGGEINQIAVAAGLKFGVKGTMEARIKSVLSESLTPIFSNVFAFDVTPYQVVIIYPSLWVPGSYQGWNPATAPKISSILSNGIYEGYVNFTGTDFQFKFTPQQDWNNGAYGWASSVVTGNNVSGTMNTTGGNLFVPKQGYYRLQANTIANEWAATLTTWTIIGDAPIASNNWVNDVPMTFDPATNQWSAVVDCKAGSFKFRANADWALNFGDTGADQTLDYDGDNLSVPSAGTYTITLELQAGNYTYSIKQ
jgi:starch-binding outer membrane protein SusE/F